MVASLCQVQENEKQKSFKVTVTVPHSPLEHTTRTDSGRVAEINVNTARCCPVRCVCAPRYLVRPDVEYHSSEKKPVAIVFAFFRVCDVNIFKMRN